MSSRTRRRNAATARAPASAPPSAAPIQRSGTMLVGGLLFVSGIAALVYQTLWVKQLSLVVGTDIHAVTVAVGTFFAGLSAGGYLFGRWADRVQRPLLLFGIIEAGVGFLGVGSTLALAHSARLFAIVEGSAGPVAWLLPFALVGVPAALMGGSLPVLVRVLANRTGQFGSSGGRLYAANTAGAVVGTLLTVFILIPKFGVFGSSLVAAGGNMAAALGAIALGRSNRSSAIAPAVPEAIPAPAGYRLALVLYAIAGGVALGYEVVWTRTIADLQHHNCLRYTLSRSIGTEHWPFGKDRRARVAVTGTLKANNGDALVAAAVEGEGIIYQPSFLVAREVQDGLLVPLDLDYPPIELDGVFALHPSDRQPPAKVRVAIDFLAERLPRSLQRR